MRSGGTGFDAHFPLGLRLLCMSLSDQPFARIPEVETLGQELKMNVSDQERTISGIASVLLMSEAPTHRGLERLILLMMGGACALRALSGRCLLYQTLGIDTRHSHAEASESKS